MSSKTKLIVLHTKEVVYTAVFLVLAVLLAVILFVMFGQKKANPAASESNIPPTRYTAGTYSSTIDLNGQTFDVEVTVTTDRISSIELENLSETAAVMYPLVEPSFESIVSQIYASQSTENISFGEENKYTSQLLLQAIENALKKAAAGK